MKLKGRMRLENGHMVATCKLFDGGTFKVRAPEHTYGLNDDFQADRDIVDGWVEVTQEGQQGNACYISLPTPSLVHGKNVTVHEYEMFPFNTTLQDYGVQTTPQVPVLPIN